MSADIERIKEMEKYLNECTEITRDLSKQIEKMDSVRDHMISLFEYYGSDKWFNDREADVSEAITAGVLSEDSVYDAITDVRDLAFSMLEQATDILKNRL